MKENPSTVSRRSFLKTSAIGSIVVASSGVGANALTAKTAAWTKGTPVNPNISDLRVVYCKDLSMITRIPPNMDIFSDINASVDSAKVKSNLDMMAKTLAQTTIADAAWAKIFQKPSGKTWAQCKVFVKVNGRDAMNMPRIPVVAKVCEELIKLQIPATNITIGDPSMNVVGGNKYTPYLGNGLPAGVVLRDEQYPDKGGGVRRTNMVKAFTMTHSRGNVDVYATKAIASATNVYVADIIVNISLNKGHIKHYVGGCTMSFKNHVGSTTVTVPSLSALDRCPGMPWAPQGTISDGTPDVLIAINTHELIMGGGTPAYPARQQLCISDSLWVGMGGEGDAFPQTNGPGYLVMGTCSPCVDWLLSDKVRIGELGIQPSSDAEAYNNTGSGYDNRLILKRFLDAFGYTSTQPQWIQAQATSGGVHSASSSQRLFTVACTSGGRRESARFNLPHTAMQTATVKIFNTNGTMVRDLGIIGSDSMVWDGRGANGRAVPAGHYIITVDLGVKSISKSISLAG